MRRSRKPFPGGSKSISRQGRKDALPDVVLLAELDGGWVWETDAALDLVFVSPGYERACGIAADSLIGSSWFDLVARLAASDDDRERLQAALDHACLNELKIHARSGAGEQLTIALSGAPKFGPGGAFAGYRGIGRVIGRKRDAAELRLYGLDEALDAPTIAILVLDADLRIEMITPAFHALWHQKPEEISVGDSFRKVMELNRSRGIYPVADEEWETYVATRLAQIVAGDVAPLEFTRADGTTLIYSVTALSDGRRLLCYADVTELKRREAEISRLSERNKLADAVLNGVPYPVFVKDERLTYVFANKAFADLFGMAPQDIVGRRDRDVVPPAERDMFEPSEAEVLATGKPIAAEVAYDREGGAGTRLVRKHRVVTDSGRHYVAATIIDVTDMKRREIEAGDARRQLEVVLESLPASVVIYDRDNRFVFANAPARAALPAIEKGMVPGVPIRSVIAAAHAAGYFRMSGDPELDKLYDVDRERWIDGYVARHDIPHSVYERRLGDGRWLKVYDDRTPDGFFVGIRVDITDLKEREAALTAARQNAVLADRAKSEFLANMSHEIRTPMNGVLGMAELLAKTDLDVKQRTFTDIIVKSGNALLTIINDILDFSKIDAGQLVLAPAPFNLREAIEDVATLISSRAKEKDLELIVRMDPALPERYVGDVGRIRQIVTNLMGNAVKFTEAGHVLVDVSGEPVEDGTRLKVSVKDTGIGIPRDKLGLIFEKFSQVDGSSTRRYEGTGLGLAITSRLVELMDGTIGVDSEEGRGSCFWFEVALPQASGAESPPVSLVDVTGARILIIDDNPVNRAILTEQMAAWKFDACAAESGAEGLRVLDAAQRMGVKVDCILLDYQMPVMSGAQIAQLIRAMPAIADVPIVMLTSVDQSLAAMQARDLSIDAQLLKPVRSAQLLEVLVRIIQRRRGGLLAPDHDAEAGESVQGMERAARPIRFAPGDGSHRVDVLVAEDNEVNQLVFTQILGETNLTFEVVQNGRLAVEACREMKPRMILMDISMPEMSGIEATQAIRLAESMGGDGYHVPIVGVTAHALQGDRELCLEAGMNDYLPKPISPRALLEKVHLWIEGMSKARARG